MLLLLLIEPNCQNLSPSLTSFLDKYAWESEDFSAANDTLSYLSEEVFLLFQSIVMAVQIKDHVALAELEDYLAPLLDSQPRSLLRRLVENLQEKSVGAK